MAAIEYRGLYIDEKLVRMIDAASKELPQLRESLDLKNREYDAIETANLNGPYVDVLEQEIVELDRAVGDRVMLIARVLKRELITYAGVHQQTMTYTANKIADLTGLSFERAWTLMGLVS